MDAKGLVVQPGEGAVWNMSPGRSAALKLQNAETAERVMAFEETAPAGTDTTFHLHYDSDELIYVLSGEFTFKIDDQVTTGGPGTCAFIPHGVVHAWKNTGAEPGRALFLYTPGGAGRMFEEARRLQRPLSSMDMARWLSFSSALAGRPSGLPRSERNTCCAGSAVVALRLCRIVCTADGRIVATCPVCLLIASGTADARRRIVLRPHHQGARASLRSRMG